jgi:energy-coupling factor transporter ATP-binding protein EcfA2
MTNLKRTLHCAKTMTSLKTLAVANYRSIRALIVPLGTLTLVTGANGSGKSNLYRAQRLLSEAAQGGIVASLAKEGGLASTLWAGPEQISRRMKSGAVPIQGGPRSQVVALRLGFMTEDVGYCIDLGLPSPEIPAPEAPYKAFPRPFGRRSCVGQSGSHPWPWQLQVSLRTPCQASSCCEEMVAAFNGVLSLRQWGTTSAREVAATRDLVFTALITELSKKR